MPFVVDLGSVGMLLPLLIGAPKLFPQLGTRIVSDSDLFGSVGVDPSLVLGSLGRCLLVRNVVIMLHRTISTGA